MKRLLFSILLVASVFSGKASAQTSEQPFGTYHQSWDWLIQQLDPTNVFFLSWTLHIPPSGDGVLMSDGTSNGRPTVFNIDGSSIYLDRTGTYPILKAAQAATKSSSVRTSYTFGTAVQVDASRDSDIYTSSTISCSLSLSGGTAGNIILEISPNGSTGWVTIGEGSASNTGALTIGLNTVQISSVNLSGFLPAGYYYRLTTASTTGTATFSFKRTQEVKL